MNQAININGVVFDHDGSDEAHQLAVSTGNHPYKLIEHWENPMNAKISLEAEMRILAGESPTTMCNLIWENGIPSYLGPGVAESDAAYLHCDDGYQTLSDWMEYR
jgi:hypothetical protein